MAKILSPLRYPGGKSRAIDVIYDIIPSNTKIICSPFFGGGSIELYCASQGMKVYGYDIFAPLTDFWKCLLKNKYRLADTVNNEFYPLSKDNFYKLQKDNRSLLEPGERLKCEST